MHSTSLWIHHSIQYSHFVRIKAYLILHRDPAFFLFRPNESDDRNNLFIYFSSFHFLTEIIEMMNEIQLMSLYLCNCIVFSFKFHFIIKSIEIYFQTRKLFACSLQRDMVFNFCFYKKKKIAHKLLKMWLQQPSIYDKTLSMSIK